MTRKDYELIANAIHWAARAVDKEDRKDAGFLNLYARLVEELGTAFERDNDKFDVRKFESYLIKIEAGGLCGAGSIGCKLQGPHANCWIEGAK